MKYVDFRPFSSNFNTSYLWQITSSTALNKCVTTSSCGVLCMPRMRRTNEYSRVHTILKSPKVRRFSENKDFNAFSAYCHHFISLSLLGKALKSDKSSFTNSTPRIFHTVLNRTSFALLVCHITVLQLSQNVIFTNTSNFHGLYVEMI